MRANLGSRICREHSCSRAEQAKRFRGSHLPASTGYITVPGSTARPGPRRSPSSQASDSTPATAAPRTSTRSHKTAARRAAQRSISPARRRRHRTRERSIPHHQGPRRRFRARGAGPRRFASPPRHSDTNPYEPRALQPSAPRYKQFQSPRPTSAKVLEAAARRRRRRERRAPSPSWPLYFANRLDRQDVGEPSVRELDPTAPWSEFIASHTARNELPQLWPCWRRPRRPRRSESQPSRGDGNRDGPRRRAAPERRQGHRIWKGLLRLRPHLPEAVASLRKLTRRPRSGTRCSSFSRIISTQHPAGGGTSTRRWTSSA